RACVLRIAQVNCRLVLTVSQLLATKAGRKRFLESPTPSWPWLFRPQHQRESSARMPHVAAPVETRRQSQCVPTRACALWSPARPIPSGRAWLDPQHHRVLSSRMAQVWRSPALTLSQCEPAATCVGERRCWVSPTPICPALLAPQHHSVPSTW